jgi:protein disulfide-isomerase-like protein
MLHMLHIYSILFLFLQSSIAQVDDHGYTSTVDIQGITFKTENSVAIINSTIFDTAIYEVSTPWLISFTAPWCGHCKSLEPKFGAAARVLKNKVTLGKVDATAEQALMARFPVKGYPTIFYIHNSDVYVFEGIRSEKALIEFATKGYKGAAKLGPTENPLGYVGVIKGKVINLGHKVQKVFRYLTDPNYVNLSVTQAVCVMAVGGLVSTAFLGLFLAWLFMPSDNQYLN